MNKTKLVTSVRKEKKKGKRYNRVQGENYGERNFELPTFPYEHSS